MKGITFRGMRQHRNSLEPVDQLYRKVSENNFYAFMNPFPYVSMCACLLGRGFVGGENISLRLLAINPYIQLF